jgi:hypothetical protein
MSSELSNGQAATLRQLGHPEVDQKEINLKPQDPDLLRTLAAHGITKERYPVIVLSDWPANGVLELLRAGWYVIDLICEGGACLGGYVYRFTPHRKEPAAVVFSKQWQPCPMSLESQIKPEKPGKAEKK